MMSASRVGLLASLLPMMTWATDFLSPGLSPMELQGRLETHAAPLVVDVRKPPEYAIVHIPGAVNIPLTELPERLDEVHSDTGVLIYCFNGSRTRKAEHILFDHNINNVYHLDGAFEKWLQGGYPVEKGGVKKTAW